MYLVLLGPVGSIRCDIRNMGLQLNLILHFFSPCGDTSLLDTVFPDIGKVTFLGCEATLSETDKMDDK